MVDNKVLELLKTEEFADKMESLENYGEVQKYFVEHGIDMSEEEIHKALDEIGSSISGEVTEEELQQVAGGGKVVAAWITGWNLGKRFESWTRNLGRR